MSTAVLTEKRPVASAPKPRTMFRVLSFVVAVCFIILVFTGIGPLLAGRHVGGLALLLHVGIGGLFAFCLALLVIACSSHYAFDLPASPYSPPAGRKLFFWLFAAGGLSLIISSVLMMFPLFGSAGQATLVTWHRWSAYIEVVIALMFVLSLLTGRRRA